MSKAIELINAAAQLVAMKDELPATLFNNLTDALSIETAQVANDLVAGTDALVGVAERYEQLTRTRLTRGEAVRLGNFVKVSYTGTPERETRLINGEQREINVYPAREIDDLVAAFTDTLRNES